MESPGLLTLDFFYREWEALTGQGTYKENLPIDIENEVRYSQLLLLSSLLIYKRNRNCFVVYIYPDAKSLRCWENSQAAV